METFISQMLPTLPVGGVLLFVLGMLYSRFKSLCRSFKVLDQRLYNHIANHPHCGPDDDPDSEEDQTEDEENEP